MTEAGIDVATSREISSLLGLEREKELLGCQDNTGSCIAELANALGADGVLLADFARLEDVIRIDLKVISAIDGHTLANYSDQVKSENAAADSISVGAKKMAQQLRGALGRPAPLAVEAVAPPAPPSAMRFWWAPVAGGAVAAGVGTIFYLQGASAYGQLTSPHNPPLTAATAISLRDNGPTNEGVGVALIAVGAVAVAAGVSMLVLGRANLAVIPTHGGGALVVGGALP